MCAADVLFALNQQMLARALVITVSAIPEQSRAARSLRIKQRCHRIDHHSVGLIDSTRLQSHASAAMTLLKLSRQPVVKSLIRISNGNSLKLLTS